VIADHRIALPTRRRNGVAARRAIVRWAVRLFRREWRQQVLLLALLTVAVAASIFFASAAYNLTPVSGNAEFGTANNVLLLNGSDPDVLARDEAAALEWFSTVDFIGHWDVPVPGGFKPLEYRSQDPHGAYGGPTLALRRGSYPSTRDEVAVTDAVAKRLDLGIGSTLALDGVARTVVGIVENPSDLGDEFALLAPQPDENPERVSARIKTSEERMDGFRPPSGGKMLNSRGSSNEGLVAAVGVLGVATVALLLVALIAASGFVVLAQRRLRQLGVLAAIGASEKHLRLVVLANGAVLGVVAGCIGAVVGLAGWLVAAQRLEKSVGFRIDPFDVPWWLFLAGIALAAATAIAAAWWPARAISRIPIVPALSGRPPHPQPVLRSAALAAVLMVAGVVSLALAGDIAVDGRVRRFNVALVCGGTIATIVGVLLVSPFAIRAFAACASRLPVAPRLAIRDLSRYRARSGAALAAISLALGVPMAILIAATAAHDSAEAGNLSNRQLLIHTADLGGPFVPEADDVARLDEQARRIAAAIEGASLVPLNVPLDPTGTGQPGVEGRMAVSFATPRDDGYGFVAALYVATPELVARYGVDLATADPDTEIFTSETGDLVYIAPRSGERREPDPVTHAQSVRRSYTSVPSSFIRPDALQRHGWEAVSAGEWLIETPKPLTGEQLDAVRSIAAEAGLSVESRDTQHGLETLRLAATSAGLLLALGILAMTVGLIRSEGASDLRTLTATGATSRARRMITAVTAGSLALLGVVLGAGGAVIVLSAGYLDDIGTLAHLPLVYVLVIVVGTPLIAAAAGWLLAGREPPGMTRQAIG
jgi:putative ABC transport system permease protein